MSSPAISIVVPVRNESGNIGPLVGEIRDVLDARGIDWELFIVDDGSTDASWREIESTATDRRVTGIRLDGPRGKSAALAAGFRRCRSDTVAMLDGDGQDDPAEIPAMLELLGPQGPRGDSVGLVNGWKTPRLDPWHKTLPSRVFNLLVGWLTGLTLHDHNCGLKVMRREVAVRLRLADDLHRFITVMAAAEGFRVVEKPVHHRPRTRGVSKYGVGRFFGGLLDLLRVATILRTGGDFHRAAGRSDSRGRTRRGVYAILVMLALGAVLGRIGAVASVDRLALEQRVVTDAIAAATKAGGPVDEQAIRARIEEQKRIVRPFLSANDRSRWLAVRAIVEKGTFAIDELVAEPGWDTIDAVAHPDASGRLRLYSSKPPLLALLAAGPYWLLHRITGWTLADHPFELGRLLVVVVGLVPLAAMILFTSRMVETVGTTDWGRIWSVALAACGTLLTTFAVVFTNHLPAAACTAASGWLVLRIHRDGLRSWTAFAAAGLAAALAAAFDLPAATWLASALILLAMSDLRRTLVGAVPAAALVAAAALGTNDLVHGHIAPPYAHRTVGGERVPIEPHGASWNPSNWYDYELPLSNGKTLVSYWRSPKGVDRGEASVPTYALHVLIGHHGILSLTPAWLLVIPGLASLAGRRHRGDPAIARFAMAIAIVSVITIGFYILRPQPDRNYGGVSSGFRWAFWMAPLWVAAVVPAADRLGRGGPGRGLALVLLGLSVLSVAYPTWSPWTMPWLQRWLIHAGWLTPT
ncbi:MAG: glycosyltransferase family 2 protein [Planctomycetia bacterium]